MNFFTNLWDFNQEKVNRWKENRTEREESLGLVGSNLLVAFQLFGLCCLVSIAEVVVEIMSPSILFKVKFIRKIKLKKKH